MKTILFIANTSYNLYNFRLPLLRSLKKKGYKVILSAPEDEYTPFLKEEFEFYSLKMLDRTGVNPLKDFVFFLELLRLLRRIKPDLVVNITIKPNIWGNLAGTLLKIPSVSIITGLGYAFIEKKFPIYQIVKILYRIALKHPKRVIFQNLDDAELFIKEKLVKPEKVKVILGSGVDVKYFNPSGKKKEKSFIVFGYAGRLLWDKGMKEMIEAIKILKKKGYSFEVHILGKPDEGNPKSVTMEQILKWEKQGLITYKGFSKDVKPFLEEIDCFVYPSYREGIPRAILEAMAMERPIITTEVPGCKETVINGINGFLVKPKSAPALAEAMEQVINLNIDELVNMGKQSYNLVKKRFSTGVVIPQYIEIIKEALEGK